MSIQGIIYVISTLILMVSFILIKKIGRKINIVSMIGVTILLDLCYNAFLCYLLTFFNISNNLYTLSIINLLISAIFIVKIVKKKKNNEKNDNQIDNNKNEILKSEENVNKENINAKRKIYRHIILIN